MSEEKDAVEDTRSDRKSVASPQIQFVDELQVVGKLSKADKKKKIPPKRRASKEREDPVVSAIRLAAETGEVSFGFKTALKGLWTSKPKLVILSKNAPVGISREISYYTNAQEVPLYIFGGTSKELGSICGKPFLVSSVSIMNEGNSNILKLVKKSA